MQQQHISGTTPARVRLDGRQALPGLGTARLVFDTERASYRHGGVFSQAPNVARSFSLSFSNGFAYAISPSQLACPFALPDEEQSSGSSGSVGP